jgi:hypothetical protein
VYCSTIQLFLPSQPELIDARNGKVKHAIIFHSFDAKAQVCKRIIGQETTQTKPLGLILTYLARTMTVTSVMSTK